METKEENELHCTDFHYNFLCFSQLKVFHFYAFCDVFVACVFRAKDD